MSAKNTENTASPTTDPATGEITVHIPPRWSDMDAYGHVNNVTVLAIMEEARIALFGPPPSSGQKPKNLPAPPLPLFETMAEGVQALIAEHGIRYVAQLPYTGEPVPVRVRIEKITPASVRVGYKILNPTDGTDCVRAFTVLAFWDAETGQLVRLTTEQRTMLEGHKMLDHGASTAITR